MANEENRERDKALWSGSEVAAEAGQTRPDRTAPVSGVSAAEFERSQADGAATVSDDSPAEAGQFRPDGATSAEGDSPVGSGQRNPSARRRRGRSIRKLGAQLLRTPVEVSDEQREALNRLGVAQDESELQILLLGRLATFSLYGEPRLALQAMDKLLEIAGKDIRTLENDENRKIKHAELALSREKFESSARSPEQTSLEKLDALIAGIDSVARAASPAPPEGNGRAGENGAAEESDAPEDR